MVLTWAIISRYLTDPSNTVLILSFWTDMSLQTVQTQISLLQEKQSEQVRSSFCFSVGNTPW